MNTTSAWLCCAVLWVLPPSALAWDVEPGGVLASLQRPEVRQTMGIQADRVVVNVVGTSTGFPGLLGQARDPC